MEEELKTGIETGGHADAEKQPVSTGSNSEEYPATKGVWNRGVKYINVLVALLITGGAIYALMQIYGQDDRIPVQHSFTDRAEYVIRGSEVYYEEFGDQFLLQGIDGKTFAVLDSGTRSNHVADVDGVVLVHVQYINEDPLWVSTEDELKQMALPLPGEPIEEQYVGVKGVTVLRVPDSDPETWRYIARTVWADHDTVFLIEGQSYKKLELDPSTVEQVDGYPINLIDADTVYFGSEQRYVHLESTENVSFLSQSYFTDDMRVYSHDGMLEGVDPNDFEILRVSKKGYANGIIYYGSYPDIHVADLATTTIEAMRDTIKRDTHILKVGEGTMKSPSVILSYPSSYPIKDASTSSIWFGEDGGSFLYVTLHYAFNTSGIPARIEEAVFGGHVRDCQSQTVGKTSNYDVYFSWRDCGFNQNDGLAYIFIGGGYTVVVSADFDKLTKHDFLDIVSFIQIE